MKKQFLRVKQLADQTFLRADKSEGLNQDELRKADNKVEFIQRALSEVGKKLPNQVEQDKRMKKYDEFNIKMSIDAAMGDDCCKETLLNIVLKESANAECMLAQAKFEYEKQVEEHVSTPINQILEKELPAISKQRKLLNKHILDKDSATNRYQIAKKNGTGTQKESNLKEEADEADIKLDQSRDLLATEMFGLLRRENEIGTFFLQLLKLQRSYHESACKLLQDVIPKLEQTVGENKIKPIFGSCLDDHLKTNNRRIAFPLEICVLSIMELGMSEEGLFRVTGSGSRMKRFKYSIDSGCFTLPLIPEYKDVHVLASTLKMYLRELPEPLLTYKLYNEWMICMDYQDEEERVTALQMTLNKLPQYNRDNLAFLMQFLHKLSKHPENRMTTSNIAIVIGPNLLWSQEKEDMNMQLCTTLNMIVELFLLRLEVFFPVDMMKFVSTKSSDLIDPEDFPRPEIYCLRNSTLNEDTNADTASPKPSSRKKTRHAPAPPSVPRTETDNGSLQDNYYHSAIGTASLNRPHKIRTESNKLQQKESPSSRRSSLVLDYETGTQNSQLPLQQTHLVNVDNTAVKKPTPAQIIDVKPNATVNNHNSEEMITFAPKPVAAPRTSIMSDTEKLQRRDSMSKSLNSIDLDGEVLMRSKEDLEPKRAKPMIPSRPASLRATTSRNHDSEHTIVKSFNTAHKLQPSLVNIQNKNFAAGHDNQIAEKEKFLGHQPLQLPPKMVENKLGDINSNSKPEVPSKPPLLKSTEKLNAEPHEKVNGNQNKASHVRTRSDGNIVDHQHQHQQQEATLLHTPPSPRNLNKPSQPPPPPPTIKSKTEPEATNL